MARISLVLSPSLATTDLEQFTTEASRDLEAVGHEVEVLCVLHHEGQDVEEVQRNTGLAQTASRGLRNATGEIVVVADPSMGYSPTDVTHVVENLASAEADVVVAARSLWPISRLMRELVGTSDPLSGLFGLSGAYRDEVVGGLNPIGSKLLWPLLGTKAGRWVDFAVETTPNSEKLRFGFNDIREFKRLADDRFGNISRLVQFCIVGASGMVVDLSSYMLLQKLLGQTFLTTVQLPVIGKNAVLAVAGALSIGLALCWNFSLNRRLTFNYARHGSISTQFLTYVLSNALGVAFSWTLRLVLPANFAFFAEHKVYAAVVGIVLATGISFSMSRWVVFSKRVPPVTAEPVTS